MSSVASTTPKQNISYPDFEKLDLRAGTVISADLPEWSKKLIRYKVDFGAEIGERTLFSGIRGEPLPSGRSVYPLPAYSFCSTPRTLD
jgi:hypothetical protein